MAKTHSVNTRVMREQVIINNKLVKDWGALYWEKANTRAKYSKKQLEGDADDEEEKEQ